MNLVDPYGLAPDGPPGNSDLRANILSNIAESQAARANSNFGIYAAREARILALSTAESALPAGIVYSRVDLNGNVLPYGGQAQSEARFLQRQIEHARNYPDADFEFSIVARANPGVELDVAEHQYIQELTGGVRASKSPLVSNLRDPVGPARRPGLGLPEPSNRVGVQ